MSSRGRLTQTVAANSTRRLFSAWQPTTHEWAAADFEPGFIGDPMMARGPTPEEGHVYHGSQFPPFKTVAHGELVELESGMAEAPGSPRTG